MVEKLGIGEQRETSARRKRFVVFGALGLVGLLSGYYIGRGEAKSLVDGVSVWSPEIAMGLLVLYVLAIAAGTLLLSKTTDEVEQQGHYKAAALAGAVYMLLYPAWFLLWKGGFTSEPIHWVVYLLFVFSMAAAMIFYRFR